MINVFQSREELTVITYLDSLQAKVDIQRRIVAYLDSVQARLASHKGMIRCGSYSPLRERNCPRCYLTVRAGQGV